MENQFHSKGKYATAANCKMEIVTKDGYNLWLVPIWLNVIRHRPGQIEDGLSGIYDRDTGYQQLFEVVELVRERLNGNPNKVATAPEFGEGLTYVGKAFPARFGKKMVAKPCYVEDGLGQYRDPQDAAFAASACADPTFGCEQANC